jgi:tetratricopeptide (TPR) repeat protein
VKGVLANYPMGLRRAVPLVAPALAAVLLFGCAAARRESPTPAPAASGVPAPAEPTAAQLQREGLEALRSSDGATARKLFEKALSKDGRLSVAHFNLGWLATARGERAAAARHYEQALALDPGLQSAILNLAAIYREARQLDRAIALLEKALDRAPFEPRYLHDLAVLYRLTGRYDQATLAARRLLARVKDDPDAYLHLALIACDQGQLPLARLYAATAQKLDPKDPSVFNNLGLVWAKLGDRRRALGNFRKALELDAHFAPALANLGALALAYRDYAAACESFEKVVVLRPSDAEAFVHLGWAYEGTRVPGGAGHRTKEAAAAFEKALSLQEDQPDALHGLARACAGELRDLPKAKAYYQRYLAVIEGPAQAKARAELAVVDERIKAAAGAERPPRDSPERKSPAEGETREPAGKPGEPGAEPRTEVPDPHARGETNREGQRP